MRPSRPWHRLICFLAMWPVAGGAGVSATAAPPQSAPARVTRSGGVTVEQKAAAVQRRRFDPFNPPPALPPMGDDADAVTQSRFGCAASVEYTIVSRTGARGRRGVRRGCTATARIDSIHVTLDLAVTVWVPNRAGPRLVAHEEGHRVISERVYDEFAAAAARAEAMKRIGQTVTASGDDCQAAADAAIRQANEEFCRAYLDATSGWATRVGNRYDVLTGHGKRDNPKADDAIRLAFEQEPPARPREADARAPQAEPPPARGPARIE